jgi:DNA-binding transcriptional MocR family regulator
MFSVHQGFKNCLRLNYGHAWDDRAESAVTTLGRLIATNLDAKRPLAP